jgi:hypothetical protein
MTRSEESFLHQPEGFGLPICAHRCLQNAADHPENPLASFSLTEEQKAGFYCVGNLLWISLGQPHASARSASPETDFTHPCLSENGQAELHKICQRTIDKAIEANKPVSNSAIDVSRLKHS